MKIVRIIILLLIFSIIMIYLNNSVFAKGSDGMITSDIKNNTKPVFTKSSYNLKTFSQRMFGFIRNIATISSVVLLAYCGLRITFGSLEQRAEYKKSLMPIVIGSLVVLFATNIVVIVRGIVK